MYSYILLVDISVNVSSDTRFYDFHLRPHARFRQDSFPYPFLSSCIDFDLEFRVLKCQRRLK